MSIEANITSDDAATAFYAVSFCVLAMLRRDGNIKRLDGIVSKA